MRSSSICLCILLCVVCQTRAEVETPVQIMFLDSNHLQLAKYADEFTSYYSPEKSNMVEIWWVNDARGAMYRGLFAILNCKFAYTVAAEVMKVPSKGLDQVESLADSPSLSRAVHLMAYGAENLSVNWEILDRAVGSLRISIAEMDQVALVSTARDALEVMVDTRDRLRKYIIKKPIDEDQTSDSL